MIAPTFCILQMYNIMARMQVSITTHISNMRTSGGALLSVDRYCR